MGLAGRVAGLPKITVVLMGIRPRSGSPVFLGPNHNHPTVVLIMKSALGSSPPCL